MFCFLFLILDFYQNYISIAYTSIVKKMFKQARSLVISIHFKGLLQDPGNFFLLMKDGLQTHGEGQPELLTDLIAENRFFTTSIL